MNRSFVCGITVIATILGASGCATPTDVGESVERAGTSEDPLYGLGSLAQAWPNGMVSVCFESGTGHPALQQKIPGILKASWGTAANLSFVGFGVCSGTSNQVRVSFSTVQNFRGATDNLGYGQRTISLIFDDTSPFTHFTYEVIHEFGHALGFAHEMKRPDNWRNGTALQCPPVPGDESQYALATGGINLTSTYDAASIMNYCPGGFRTTLSAGDIAGARAAYGAPLARPPAGAGIAAFQQLEGQVISMSVGADGALNEAWEIADGPWGNLKKLTNVGFAPPGAPVVIDRQYSNQVDAFVVGNDGALYVLWERDNGPWSAPVAITSQNVIPKGARLATGRQGAQLDVFYVDNAGALNVSWPQASGVWSSRRLSSTGFAPVGAPVAAGLQGSNQLDAFVVDNNGNASVFWVPGNGAWAGPAALFKAPVGASLATGIQNSSQLDLFFVDGAGALSVEWVSPQGWAGPARLTTTSFAPAGANLTTSLQNGTQLDVFAVDNQGALTVTWATQGASAWGGPYRISGTGIAPAGSPASAAIQRGTQIDVLLVGYQGLGIASGSVTTPWSPLSYVY
jgi:hypothetical protein